MDENSFWSHSFAWTPVRVPARLSSYVLKQKLYNRGSSVGIVTVRTGQPTILASIPRMGKTYFSSAKRTDRLWKLPILLLLPGNIAAVMWSSTYTSHEDEWRHFHAPQTTLKSLYFKFFYRNEIKQLRQLHSCTFCIISLCGVEVRFVSLAGKPYWLCTLYRGACGSSECRAPFCDVTNRCTSAFY